MINGNFEDHSDSLFNVSIIPTSSYPLDNNPIQKAFYIYPDGDDDNSGTEDSPFKTFEKAKNEVRLINSNMTGDIVVYVMEGTYNFDAALEFGPQDSGTNGFNIIYKNYTGHTPILSGGKFITGWTLYDAEKDIWEADATGIETRQLYVNGNRATRARSKNGLPGAIKTDTGYTTTDINIQNWANISDMEFVYNVMWTQSRVGVASISGAAITMKQPAFEMNQNKPGGGFITPTIPTYIENAYELLDQQGEWYLNRKTHKIYYKPKAGESMDTAEVIAPVLETLVKGTGKITNPIHNIQFQGLTFSYATWLRPSGNEGFAEIQGNFCRNPIATADGNWSMDTWVQTPGNIDFIYAKGIRFERNTFRHLGGVALHFGLGSQNNIISGNKIYDISSSGVQIGGGSREDHHPSDPAMVVKNNEITNNYIYDIGAEYKGALGIWVGYADGTHIAHNEIAKLPYAAISVGWGWGTVDSDVNPTTSKNNLIENNYIHDIMNILMDGGGIYTLGAQPGTVITRNVVTDQHNDYGSIYLDDGSRYITVQNNIMFGNVRNMIIKGLDHTITNNYWDKNANNMYWQRDSILENNTLIEDGNFPLSIINNAGLQHEYQDLLPEEGNKNLALQKPVRIYNGTATSIVQVQEGHDGEKTADNDLTSYTTVADSDSPWIIEIDLKRIQIVSGIVLNFTADNTTGQCIVTTSVNGTTWNSAATISQISAGRNIVYLGNKQVRNVRLQLSQGLIALSEVEAYGSEIPLIIGEAAQLYFGSNQNVVFLSGNAEKVSVDENGHIEALATGNAAITGTSQGTDYTLNFSVGEFADKRIELDKNRIIIGKQSQLSVAGITTEGMKVPVNMGTITYNTDDTSYATVDACTGLVTGIQEGTVEVTATHVFKEITQVLRKSFSVIDEVLDTVELSTDKEIYYLTDGATQLTLEAKLNSGESYIPGELAYISDNTSVAAVTATGLMTIVGEGTATISVDVTYGGETKTASTKIKVLPAGWKYANIKQAAGSASYTNGVWSIEDIGDDIWGTSDQFTYVYKEIDMADYTTGVSIVASIDSISEGISPNTMTGLMIRESIDAASKNVNYRIHSGNIGTVDKFVPMTYRLKDGGDTNYKETQSLNLPAIIKLSRVGNDIYAHYLNALNNWIEAGVVKNISMADKFTIGIVHCSQKATQSSETTVSEVQIGMVT